MKDVFLKKRRNLIIFSLVVYFIETTDVLINKINVFGTELSINNPGFVNIWIWLAFIYSLLMYYYYFIVVEKDGEFNYRKNLHNDLIYSRYINDKYFKMLGGFYNQYFVEAKNYIKDDSKIYKDNDCVKIRLKFERSVLDATRDKFGRNIPLEDIVVNVSKLHYYYCFIKSFIITSIKTKYFFESYLPFVMAGIVIVTKILSVTCNIFNGL